jgi:hypothetical protein
MCSVQSETKLRRDQGAWLAAFREAAGYRSARAAALENGWPESTYRAHEAGTRTIGQDDAQRYARRFQAKGVKVTAQSILFGDPEAERSGISRFAIPQTTAPLVGYVGAGSEARFYAVKKGSFLDEVPAPQDSTSETVALEIRGDSLGLIFDRWLVFYDDLRRPVTADLIGKVCVVGLPDDRVLIKKIRAGSKEGFYRLFSEREPDIKNVSIDWAAKVKSIVPR